MKMLKKPKVYIVLLSFLILSSCKDLLDINTDPNNPVNAPLNQVLPGAQVAIGYNLGTVTGGLSNAASTFVHQVVSFRVDQYAITGDYVNNTYFGLYTNGLNELEIIINKGTASGDFRYVGIAKIMKAYTYSIMVDLFGDIPYSEALQGARNEAPKFDDDKEIYESLFTLLDEGIADLQKTGGLAPGADDVIYGGDLVKWRRFAKTLKLKMYNQIRLERNVAPQVTALITEGDLIRNTSARSEDFELPFGVSIQPPNRNPAYLAEYAGSGRESFVSEWFYNIMQGKNPAILTDIVDPRIPYYFYNQKATPAQEANANYQDGRFISRRFGTTLSNINVSTIQTLHGLYPIGGRYDDGNGGTGQSGSGPGNGAQRLLPVFSRIFTEAELGLTLGVAGINPRASLEQGIREAFSKVNRVALAAAAVPTSPAQTIPQIPETAITTYVNSVLAQYDATPSVERKLEIIMTQKWIASYGFGIDSYTDYRRTGYPRLYEPSLTDNTESANPFPLRFPYRTVDLVTNPNAPEQANVYTDRIFWDIN